MWEYQWSNFIYNCMSTFLHYIHCKDALLECSAPGGERCESLTWVDEISERDSKLFKENHTFKIIAPSAMVIFATSELPCRIRTASFQLFMC